MLRGAGGIGDAMTTPVGQVTAYRQLKADGVWLNLRGVHYAFVFVVGGGGPEGGGGGGGGGGD